ncbi:glycine zipper 2TM domain-containing protein [Sphingobium sp.]|uniref:glycine zipper 2TM domain-containing protein n=1 Tax=Sphingobium sp. TaxID=1912891 RepID=UPI0035C68591
MGMKTVAMAMAFAATVCGALPSAAMAHGDWRHDNGRHRGWHKHGRYYDDGPRYRREAHYDRRGYRGGCRTSGTTGAIIGAGAGALLGRSVDRYGDRLPGTIIGAGAGALIGKEIDSKRRC